MRRRQTKASLNKLALAREMPRPLWIVALCFLLSGFCALIYQTVWARQFSILLGTSHLAIAAILAAYMAGLAFGSAVAERWVGRIRRPLLTYGLLECGIALSALCLPLLMTGLKFAFGWVFQSGDALVSAAPGHFWFYAVGVLVVVVVPTALMGATLPLLVRYVVVSDRDVGPNVSFLYGINTIGAVIGAASAGFLLVPMLGLWGATLVAAVGNGAVMALIVFLFRESEGTTPETPQPSLFTAGEASMRSKLVLRWVGQLDLIGILFLSCAAGAVAFVYEILWTRLLAQVFGGTTFAFATMLATFLAGLGVGGLLARWIATTRLRALYGFSLSQAGAAIASLMTYEALGPLKPDQIDATGMVFYSAAIMLPATLFLGFSFPCAVRFITTDASRAGQDTARTYAWNTLGAIVGALITGFAVLPLLGLEGTLKLAVMANVAISVVALLFCPVPRHRLFALAPLALGLGITFWYQPSRPDSVVFHGLGAASDRGREVFYAVGRSSTVVVRDINGSFEMSTDGLPEASVVRVGQVPVVHSQRWMTLLPLLARPNAESMMVIGLGGGIALETIPATIKTIAVVELEPQVVRANVAIAGERAFDPLADPRVELAVNDARTVLSLSNRQYDVIASQPSHPWTAGASHLYTQEFVSLARSRLKPGGIFVQWINAEYVDEALLRSLMATVAAEFPIVRLYHPTPGVLYFLASAAPIQPEREAIEGRLDLKPFASAGVAVPEDILASLALEDSAVRALAAGSPVNTDNRNRLAVFSRSRADGLKIEDLRGLFGRMDPLVDSGSWVHAKNAAKINFPYVASQLLQRRFQERAFDVTNATADLAMRALANGVGYSTYGQLRQAAEAFVEALRYNQGDVQAIFSLIRPHLPALMNGTADPAIMQLSQALSGSSAAVVRGWQLGEKRDWAALEQLDQLLATSKVTDAWFPQAAKLRAEWRLAKAQIERSSATAQEAVEILNQVLGRAPSFDLALLRAGAGALARNEPVFIESLALAIEVTRIRVQQAAERRYAFSDGEAELMRTRLMGAMDQLRRQAAANSRAQEVLQKATVIAGSLQGFSSPR